MAIRIGITLVVIVVAIFFNRQYTLLGFRHDPNSLKDKHFEGFECNDILQDTGAEDISTTADGLAFITTGMLCQFLDKLEGSSQCRESIHCETHCAL